MKRQHTQLYNVVVHATCFILCTPDGEAENSRTSFFHYLISQKLHIQAYRARTFTIILYG